MNLKARLVSVTQRPETAQVLDFQQPQAQPALYEQTQERKEKDWSLAERLAWGALSEGEMEWQAQILTELLTMIDLSIIAQIEVE